MRSRYEHDQNHPDSWPGENWLTDWWHGLTSRRRWAAGAGVVLAVVLALTGVAIAGGSLILLSTFLIIVRLLASAAFLAGVYGAFGQAAASGALVAVALVIEVVALLPIVQVKWLMSRAGRRVYA